MSNDFWRAQQIFQSEAHQREEAPAPAQWDEPRALTGHPQVNAGFTNMAVAERMGSPSRVWDPERYRQLRRSMPHITDAHVSRATGRDSWVVGGWGSGGVACSGTDREHLEELFGVGPGSLCREV
jgi:hypothetical protein